MGEGREQTVGDRIYLIREALGTRRDPMPLDKFAELIEREAHVSYDKSVLSRMETGDRRVSLDDVKVLASVDPFQRGRDWLAWGDDEGTQGAIENGTPKTDRPRRGSDIPVVDGDPRKYAQEVKTPPARKRRKRPPGDRTAVAG